MTNQIDKALEDIKTAKFNKDGKLVLSKETNAQLRTWTKEMREEVA